MPMLSLTSILIEYNRPYFDTTITNDDVLDIPATFHTTGAPVLLAKAFLFLWNLGILLWIWITQYLTYRTMPMFFWAYLTHWTLLMVLIYQGLSVWNALSPAQILSHRHLATWLFFTVGSHASLLITPMFWGFVYDPNIDLLHRSIAEHGLPLITVLIQGWYLDAIPIRLRHWNACFGFYMLYLLWSVVHDIILTGMGNPHYEKQDSIYNVLDWKNTPGFTGLLVTALFLVVAPVLYLVLWCVQLWICPERRRPIKPSTAANVLTASPGGTQPLELEDSYGRIV